ncbi:MAG: N-acetyl-gamma-glutamyl-phosphate reductase, partial [Bryobacteraceae bacterium]
MKRRVGIVGFRGYSGQELLRILKRHRHAEPWLLEHRGEVEEAPRIRRETRPSRLPLTPEAVREHKLAVVFLATPPEVSLELAPVLLDAGARVIDLSGAFRLRLPETYRRWYRAEHTQPVLLAEAVYGLPEFYRERIRNARLVANPG